MKKLCFFLFAAMICLTSCKSKNEISPSEAWSQGCAYFEVFQDGYRLYGLCCAYIIIPKLKLYKDKSFSEDADFYAFTGAGYSSQPIKVSGKLSKDGKTISLTYTVSGKASSFNLISGRSNVACDCFCD